MESMLKQSPESSAQHGSAEVSQEQAIPLEAPHLISSSYARTASSPEKHAAVYYQPGPHGEAMMVPIVKEEPHPGSIYSVEHLGWDVTQELVHSMSPESASLCKNLSSQLEHLRKEFGSCYQHAESSNSNTHFVLHQQPHQLHLQEPQPGVMASESSNMATGSELIGSSSVPLNPDNEMLKAAIVSHPSYPELVAAHMNFHKVGAPPEVVSQIDEIIQSFRDFQPAVTTSLGVNPELDQFMISYYSMLMKYEKEIKKTFKEAVAFCKKLEQQLQGVTNTSLTSVAASVESDDRIEGYESSDEYDSSAEAEIEVDPMAKDKELKEQLMRKYSGYISSLKHEFLKKKKKGKLPKDSRQQLLNWWSLHYKWPYPSESEKASLAESTGLDQKQINNWFINQRKRHWKPSDDLSGQASQSTVTETNSGA